MFKTYFQYRAERYKLDMDFIPDGVSGDWSISTVTVGEREFSQLMSVAKTGRGIPAGTYKLLARGETVVMSNTPDEIADFSLFTDKAHGIVLINGLGLGCTVKALLDKPEIDKITVIENSPDVINLVAPYFKDERLEVIEADAFTYQPPKGMRYNFVWHDIWDFIDMDNLPEMAKLHRKYGRRTNWQDSWAKHLCLKERKKYKNFYAYAYYNVFD